MLLFSYGMFGIIMLYTEVIMIELSPNIVFILIFNFFLVEPRLFVIIDVLTLYINTVTQYLINLLYVISRKPSNLIL